MTPKNNACPYLLQCESRWKYLVKKFKEYIANKKQSGARRRSFEYAEEMGDALEGRHDIFPPTTVGSNIKVDAPSAKRSVPSDSDSEPRQKKKNTPKNNTDDAIERCVSVIEQMAKQQMANETRRLDLLERIANSLANK